MTDDNARYRSSDPFASTPDQGGHGNDPLAELARLIGQSDPFADLARGEQQHAPPPRAPQPYDDPPPQDEHHSDRPLTVIPASSRPTIRSIAATSLTIRVTMPLIPLIWHRILPNPHRAPMSRHRSWTGAGSRPSIHLRRLYPAAESRLTAITPAMRRHLGPPRPPNSLFLRFMLSQPGIPILPPTTRRRPRRRPKRSLRPLIMSLPACRRRRSPLHPITRPRISLRRRSMNTTTTLRRVAAARE